MSAPLVWHISPSDFPALQDCTWRLDTPHMPQWPATVSPIATTIARMRNRNLNRAGPLKFAIRLDGEYYAEILQPALEELGIRSVVNHGAGGGGGGGGVAVIGIESSPPVTIHPVNPPSEVILVPKMYCKDLEDDNTAQEIGDAISVSLDRIRDLKDQAVAVGDRLQVRRIAQALQEGEWLCVERGC